MIASTMPGRWSALDYHLGTQHPNGELMQLRRPYLPSMRPVLFKRYRSLPAVELEIGKPAGEPPALSAIGEAGEGTAEPDLDQLARLLHYSAGITKRIRGYAFRAAACTGALYHIELYLVCAELEGLPAGVYHYDPEGSRLLRLREGDYREWLAEAAGASEAVRQAPATLVCTDLYWRNAIKYQARAYRHAFWDGGTLLANTLAMAKALELPARLVMGFVDGEVARLLGIDPAEELPLALVPLGGNGEPAGESGQGPGASRTEAGPGDRAESDGQPRPPAELSELNPEVERQPSGSRTYPAIPRIHRDTSFDTADQVREWRELLRSTDGVGSDPSSAESKTGATTGEPNAVAGGGGKPLESSHTHELEVPPPSKLPDDSLERAIVRRGSSRAFSREPIAASQLAVVLDRCLRDTQVDGGRLASSVRLYLIASAVERLDPGIYRVLSGTPPLLRQIRSGEFRTVAGQLALGQALGADAAVNLYFMAPLEQVLQHYGERGYRLAQMEAAIRAGWGYLTAYALGLGATGLTFYDEMVEQFFGVADERWKVMFLLAVGVPYQR